jgi:myo-inositol-1(or 4)-monophosphatase
MVSCDKIISAAKEAALTAGAIISSSSAGVIEIKSPTDYVTDIDFKCQKEIIDIIKSSFPGHNILAEESDDRFSGKNDLWIIDPLDGTTNFIHGLSHSCVSIAYFTESEVKAGVIYDPYRKEMFSAVKGRGAYLNGERLIMPPDAQIKKCLIATGMPFRNHDKVVPYFMCLSGVLKSSSGIRRMGSAALDLAWTAAGRFGGFFEGWLSPWDIAAGVLIIEESGGRITDFKGEKNYFHNGCVVAAGESVFPVLFSIVNENLKDEQ